jgi:ATP-dependent Clp protease ATP-binding subunit ClpB
MTEKDEELLKNEVFGMLRSFLRPEFLNRIDEIVMFKPLTIDQIKEIVKIQIISLENMMNVHGIRLVAEDKVIDWLAQNGFDPQSGARPVKRLIQKEIINELSKEIISGRISKEDTVILDIEKNKVSFRNKTTE